MACLRSNQYWILRSPTNGLKKRRSLGSKHRVYNSDDSKDWARAITTSMQIV